MKKAILLCAAITLAAGITAQTYSFKKSKINANDVPIGKYDSKGGVFKNLRIKITSLDDQPLINVQQFNYDFENPFLASSNKKWLVIFFEGNPVKTAGYELKPETTEKDIMDLLFKANTPGLIKENKLDNEQVEKFITVNHYEFSADSLSIVKMEEENKARIKGRIPRDTKQPVELRGAGRMGEVQLFDIYQANILIGRVEKRTHEGAFEPQYDYSVWMKTEPYLLNGNSYPFSPVAYFTRASPTFDNYVVMMKDKTKVKFKTPGTTNASAEYSFVNFLISSGNL